MVRSPLPLRVTMTGRSGLDTSPPSRCPAPLGIRRRSRRRSPDFRICDEPHISEANLSGVWRHLGVVDPPRPGDGAGGAFFLYRVSPDLLLVQAFRFAICN